jgi:hypothetical protein
LTHSEIHFTVVPTRVQAFYHWLTLWPHLGSPLSFGMGLRVLVLLDATSIGRARPVQPLASCDHDKEQRIFGIHLLFGGGY